MHELKFDGYRLLCHIDGKQIRFWTRNQKDWTAKFASVAKAVKALPVKSAILDGEIVALDPSGRASFQRLQQSINKGGGSGLIFHIFDLIYIEGIQSHAGRRCASASACWRNCWSLWAMRACCATAITSKATASGFSKEACKLGIEGIVSKHANSAYKSTRSRNWLKIKCHQAAGVCDCGIYVVGQGNSVQLA